MEQQITLDSVVEIYRKAEENDEESLDILDNKAVIEALWPYTLERIRFAAQARKTVLVLRPGEISGYVKGLFPAYAGGRRMSVLFFWEHIETKLRKLGFSTSRYNTRYYYVYGWADETETKITIEKTQY